MHGRLLTNMRNHRLGLGAPFCPHCEGIVESMLHVLRDCPRDRLQSIVALGATCVHIAVFNGRSRSTGG